MALRAIEARVRELVGDPRGKRAQLRGEDTVEP
jgi:hypothetical protein